MFIKKTKLYFTIGTILLVQSVTCLITFIATYHEKKSYSSALYALTLALGAVGASLIAISDVEAKKQRSRIRRRMSDRDHWFHNFEYPECTDPTLSIEDLKIPPVETED